jgi:hypothetical protein
VQCASLLPLRRTLRQPPLAHMGADDGSPLVCANRRRKSGAKLVSSFGCALLRAALFRPLDELPCACNCACNAVAGPAGSAERGACDDGDDGDLSDGEAWLGRDATATGAGACWRRRGLAASIGVTGMSDSNSSWATLSPRRDETSPRPPPSDAPAVATAAEDESDAKDGSGSDCSIASTIAMSVGRCLGFARRVPTALGGRAIDEPEP